VPGENAIQLGHQGIKITAFSQVVPM